MTQVNTLIEKSIHGHLTRTRSMLVV
uniref:Uncharacterized protein n=1 Tax=Rhizophora mucronata TaxID=61149 RepID=A0A2P2NZM0_RHIMU